jgi:hypothetical protein
MPAGSPRNTARCQDEKVTVSTHRVPGGRVPPIDDDGIPLDLRLAVTGHRELAGAPALGAAIDRALDLIQDQLRPSVRKRCRLVAVSALADGADRLVVDRVLARRGARLEVILPMAKADYVTDFDPAHSLAEFERLLGEASWVATMPPHHTREDAYAAAGRAVADRADVTIAIWDGHPAAGKGGTGDIVGYLRERRHPWIWLPADGGQARPENLRKLAKTDWPGITDAELASWGKFNENRLDDGRRSAFIDQFRDSILKAGGTNLAADLAVLLDWLQAPFARAELLSRKFQARYLHLSAMLFVLAALAVCIVGTQLVFFPHTRLVVAGEIACLVIILGGLEWGRRAHLQQRWISARYLAERLRGALFLALAGAGELSSATALVSEDIPVAPWVGTAFEMTWMRRPQVDADTISVSSLRRFLSVAWIDDQQHYFKESAALSWRKYRFSSRAVEVLFATSVVIAIIHVALDGPENWIKHAVSLLAIGIPACAAALVGYYTQREYLRNSRRYDRMARSLASANRIMLRAADHDKVREVAGTVDQMFRQERGEWFGTVGLHDLELPA